jgi:hypothetical protein
MSDPPWIVSLIVAWLPFMLLMWISWYVGRALRRGLFTKDGRSLADVTLELTDELKRLNDRSK